MYLTYLWKNKWSSGWILVLIVFSHLWSHPVSLEHQEICHDFREDGSWLFLVTVTSVNLNNITGHTGARITCNKGTLTQTSFFCYHFFYFCGHFLGVALTIKLLSVHSPSIWFVASLLRLAVRVINWLEVSQRADDVRRWPCKSVSSPGSCVLSPRGIS